MVTIRTCVRYINVTPPSTSPSPTPTLRNRYHFHCIAIASGILLSWVIKIANCRCLTPTSIPGRCHPFVSNIPIILIPWAVTTEMHNSVAVTLSWTEFRTIPALPYDSPPACPPPLRRPPSPLSYPRSWRPYHPRCYAFRGPLDKMNLSIIVKD